MSLFMKQKKNSKNNKNFTIEKRLYYMVRITTKKIKKDQKKLKEPINNTSA